MMSEPPKRCGFSKEWVATSAPVSRSYSRTATVVVPTSTARPWSGPSGLRDDVAVQQHAPAVARHRRIERRRAPGQPFGVGLDAQRAAAQRVAPDHAGSGDARTAGQAEAAGEVVLLRRRRAQERRALLHLHQALPALALLHAGGRDAHARRLRALEEARALLRGDGYAVDGHGQCSGRHRRGPGGRHASRAARPAGTAARVESCMPSRRLNSSTAVAASAA